MTTFRANMDDVLSAQLCATGVSVCVFYSVCLMKYDESLAVHRPPIDQG